MPAAQGIIALLQRQPGVEIIQNGGPGATAWRVPARRQCGANARARRRHARRIRVERRNRARGDPARADRADRDPARPGVEPVRRGCDRRRHPGVHEARQRRRACQCVGRLRHVRHLVRSGRASSGGSGAARGSVQIAGRRSDGFNAIVNPANFSYDPDRDGYRDASVSAYGELRFMPEHALSAQYFTSRLDNQFDAGDAFDDRTVTTLATWQVAIDRSVHAGMDVASIGGRRQRQVGVEDARSAISRSRRTSGNTRGKTTSRCRPAR